MVYARCSTFPPIPSLATPRIDIPSNKTAAGSTYLLHGMLGACCCHCPLEVVVYEVNYGRRLQWDLAHLAYMLLQYCTLHSQSISTSSNRENNSPILPSITVKWFNTENDLHMLIHVHAFLHTHARTHTHTLSNETHHPEGQHYIA